MLRHRRQAGGRYTKDDSLAGFVCPPAFVQFTIVICVSRDCMKTTYSTGSRSLNWFVVNLWNVLMMKLWIYENRICELRSEKLNEEWSQPRSQGSLLPALRSVGRVGENPGNEVGMIIAVSYIHNFIIILSRVYNEPIQRPAPSWLVSLISRALHRHRTSRVRIPYKTELFSGFLCATAKVAYITAMIILHLILHSAVHIYDFHTFITSVISELFILKRRCQYSG